MGYEATHKFRSSEDLKTRWIAACEDMKVSQSEVFRVLAELWLSLPELDREAVVRRGASVKVVVRKK